MPQTGKGAPDALLAAFQAAGATVPAPVKSLTLQGVPIDLTTEEQRQYQQIRGQLLEQYSAKTIADPRFVNSSPAQQRYSLEFIKQKADTAASDMMFHGMDRAQLIQRFQAGRQQVATKQAPMQMPPVPVGR